MKKSFAALLILITAVFLMSCGSNGYYDQGYEDGYKNGLEDGYLEGYLQSESEGHGAQYESGYESGYDDGFFEGKHYGHEETMNRIYYASEYARSKTGWSIYEAYNNIMIYHDGVDPDGFPLPTKKEYIECVETLVYFSEYLDNLDFEIK
jgi:hypothetical protein